MSERNLLITGGAGFIGSHFSKQAIHQYEQLVILDKLTYAGSLSNLTGVLESAKVQFIKGDVCDRELISRLFRDHKISHVAHFAAESHVDRSIDTPEDFIETNVNGTATLLEVARLSWVSPEAQRFLHISTDEVYGSLSPQDSPRNELAPYKPNNPYAASKAASNHLARSWFQTYGLPVIISNCSNNFGRHQHAEKLIPSMISKALAGEALPLYGDGLQVRDWIHVDDHCRALLLALEKAPAGETYNIGASCERSNLHVVERICECVDKALDRQAGQSKKLIQHVKDRPGHDRRYALDASKVRQDLGWSPRFSIDHQLQELVDWFVDQKS